MQGVIVDRLFKEFDIHKLAFIDGFVATAYQKGKGLFTRASFDSADEIQTIAVGHIDVTDDDVKGFACKKFEGFIPTYGTGNKKSLVAKDVVNDFKSDGIIIHGKQ